MIKRKQRWNGEYTIRGRKFPKLFVVGLVGVVLMYFGVAGMISVDAPWIVQGDTIRQVDYVWRLSNGELPKRTDNVRYPAFVKVVGPTVPQAASKSPPLFYAIQAIFIGPLLHHGAWQKAIALGRAINLLFGVLCILVLSWAGWLFGGTRKWLHALAVPALAVLIFRFTRLNVDFANDTLLTLFGTLSTIFSYKLFKYGPTKKYLSLITLVSVGGMLTKVSFIVFVATNLLAVFLAHLLQNRPGKPAPIRQAVAMSAGVFAITLLASGWYYYLRDYKISGSWVNAVPLNHHSMHRHVRAFSSVITGSKLWGLLFNNYTRAAYLSPGITGFALSGVLTALNRKTIKRVTTNRPLFWALVLMGLSTLGIFLTQLQHATGTGSINFRYMLPALLPFGLFLSYGLLQLAWSRGMFVGLVAILMGVTSIGAYALPGVGFFPSHTVNRFIGGMFTAAQANSVPSIVPGVLLLAFAGGALLFCRALFGLSGSPQTTNTRD